MNLTLDQKIEVVHKSLKETFSDATQGLIKKENWIQRIVPEGPSFLMNGVMYSLLKADEMASKIDDVICEYQKNGVESFRWVIGPQNHGTKLLETLLAKGFQKIPQGYPGAGMVFVPEGPIQIKEIPNFEFRVATKKDLDDYLFVLQEGFLKQFSASSAGRKMYFETVAKKIDSESGHVYLGYFENKPVANVDARTFSKNCAYLSGLVVLPEFRRRGFGELIAAKMINDLQQKGIQILTTQTLGETSRPGAEKMGFETICQVDTLLYYFSK